MSIAQEMRDATRFKEILDTLLKHEMGYFIEKLNLKRRLSFRKRVFGKFEQKNTNPERMRLVLEELGATFVKLGQLLSLRPDLIPKEYCDEFRKLQDSVPPFPSSEAKKIIEQELGKPIDKLFKNIEMTPIASASVSQVYIAQLQNGKKVAVKVQRPGIKKIFETDIDILYHLAYLSKKKLSSDIVDPVMIVKEFERYTRHELDFIHEARNIEKFYQEFKKSKNMVIPKVYWELTTSKVLVMDFIKGTKLSEADHHAKINRSRVARNIVNSMFDQIFEKGYFHADPHQGNIIVLPNNKIAFIDFGIVGEIDYNLRNSIIGLCFAIVNKDLKGISKGLYETGFMKDESKLPLLERDIQETLGPYYYTSLKQLKFSEVLNKILDVSRRNDVKLPSDFALLIKSLVTLEGVAYDLDPKYKIVEEMKPKIKKMMLNRLSTKSMYNDALVVGNDYAKLMKNLPKNITRVLDRVSEGNLKIDIQDTDIHKLTIEMDRSSNRITYGLIIAALVVASALIAFVDKGPKYLDVPILAIIGFVVAGLLGLVLISSISREGRY